MRNGSDRTFLQKYGARSSSPTIPHWQSRKGGGRKSGALSTEEWNEDPFVNEVELMTSTDHEVINEAQFAAQTSGSNDAMREELQEDAE